MGPSWDWLRRTDAMEKFALWWIFLFAVFLQVFHQAVTENRFPTTVEITTAPATNPQAPSEPPIPTTAANTAVPSTTLSTTPTTISEVSTDPPTTTTAITKPKTQNTTSTTTTQTTTTLPVTTTVPSATPSTTLSTTASTTTPTAVTNSTTPKTSPTEFCSPGYSLVNGACKDIDECRSEYVRCPFTTSCENLDGGFTCVCRSGLVKRKLAEDNDWRYENQPKSDGNITWFCLYTVTVKQHFGLKFTSALSNSSSIEYKNVTTMLHNKILSSYMEEDGGALIADINIFSLTGNPFLVHYEVMSGENDKVDISTLTGIHNMSVNAGFWSTPDGLPGVNVEFPSSGQAICLNDSVQSRKVLNRIFIFPTTNVDTLESSEETCANSGYAASIECVQRTNRDGSVSAYYDAATLKELSCSENTSKILDQLDTTNLTSQTLETTLGGVSATSTYSSPRVAKDLISTLDKLQKTVNNEDIDVTENTMTYLLWTVDNLYDKVQTTPTLLTNEDKLSLARILENFASNLIVKNEVFSVTSQSNIFQARKINCTHGSGNLHFNESLSKDNDSFQPHVSSVIPRSAIPSSCNESITAVYYLHRDSIMFPTSVHNINQVFSSQLSRTQLSNLKDPITHSFSQPARGNGTHKDFMVHRCAYLDLSTGVWLHDGCTTTVVNSGNTACDCDHTTNFAVLVQSFPVAGNYVLSIFGYIGCSLSTLGLILVMIIYLSFKKLRTNQINQLHIHLSSCLIVAYLTFLIGVDRTRAYASCIAVGFILQFTFLSAWGWMLAECFTMYKKFVKVFSHMSSAYVMKASCIVYSLSLFVTSTTFVAAYIAGDSEYGGWELAADNDPLFYPSYYVSDRLCWLHGYSLYFGFLAPVGLMFIANIYGYFRIIRILTNPQKELRSNKIDKNDLKTQAFRILTVSVLLGITWVFAIPLTLTDDVIVNEVFGWLFSIANAFQGVFIFLLFCVKREDVRSMWIKQIPLLNKIQSKKKNSTGTSSSGVVGNSTSDTAAIIASENKYPGTNVKASDGSVELKKVKNIRSVKFESSSLDNDENKESENKNNTEEISRKPSTNLTRLQQQSYGRKHAQVVTHF